ncbi:MAG: DUF3225 domain-containing protein, partial [Actinomycetota bacterium]|nr:DUF3225 domain-containing protein [Actinomycetota bacterium]
MEVNIPAVVAEVEAQFHRYEQAFVANDTAVLDELFWNSPQAVRFGAGENLYGHEAIARFRRGRPAVDLAREMLRVHVTTFGSDLAAVSAEFRRSRSG